MGGATNQPAGRVAPPARPGSRGTALDRIGDALWPPTVGCEATSGRAWGLFASAALGVALVLVLRRIDGIANPQFWAEDGTIFFQENLKLGCWAALQTYFRGFPYVFQTLAACVATPVPIVHAPLVYNLTAYAVAALSLATFALPRFRHVLRTDALRVVLCLTVAAQAQARELVGSLTNTGWFLGIWLMLLTIMPLPRTAVARAFLLAACWLATFSTPQSILTAPLWLARAIHASRRGRWHDVAFAALAVAGLAALVLAAGNMGRDDAPLHLPVRAGVNLVALRVLAEPVLNPIVVAALVERFGTSAVHVVAVACLGVLGVLAWRAGRGGVPVLLYCAYGIAGSCVLALLGHRYVVGGALNLRYLIDKPFWVSGRYQVLAVALLYLAVLAMAEGLPQGRARRFLIGAVLVWLAASEAPTFVLRQFEDLQWPVQAAKIEHKLAMGPPEPLIIPINPDRYGYHFKLAFDVRAHVPEVPAVRPVALARLLPGTTVEQTFVARCDRLSEIDVPLGAHGQATGIVHAELWDDARGEPVARFEVDAVPIRTAVDAIRQKIESADIEKNARLAVALHRAYVRPPLYFPAIEDSDGRRYVLRLSATGGTLEAAISVWGGGEKLFPDGEARVSGQAIDGDLAFQYGCTLP